MKEVAMLMDVSESVVSKWMSNDRKPSFTSALAAGDLFKVDAGRLARADFGDLLAHELADAERYKEVEATIERKRREMAKQRIVVPLQTLPRRGATKRRGPKKTH
jgi:transcriptional regulator with XRE-family HTH domain